MLVQAVCLVLISGGGLELFNWCMNDGLGMDRLTLARGRIGLAALVVGVVLLGASIVHELAQ